LFLPKAAGNLEHLCFANISSIIVEINQQSSHVRFAQQIHFHQSVGSGFAHFGISIS